MKLLLIAVGALGSVLYFGNLIPGSGRAESRATDAQVSYWASGKPKSSVTWTDGRREGPAEEWYADGSKREQGEYLAGERSGRWNFWRADGSLDAAQSGVYEGGRRIAD
jgi:antitoxin component YwqK of YwqJK toxin-antitoxin module